MRFEFELNVDVLIDHISLLDNIMEGIREGKETIINDKDVLDIAGLLYICNHLLEQVEKYDD